MSEHRKWTFTKLAGMGRKAVKLRDDWPPNAVNETGQGILEREKRESLVSTTRME